MIPRSYDLHTHSTFSDGLLRPAELVAHAAAADVTCLALTDHDELAGLGEAHAAAREHGIELVDAVEISVTWRTCTLHVVGLHIDPGHPGLAAGLAAIRGGRHDRARRIGNALERIGILGSLEGARARALNPELVSRTHFARFLVDEGHARDLDAAFRRYLGSGAPGSVAHQWAELGEAVGWIKASGGLAVIAHPARYKLDHRGREDLLAEFRDAGGAAVEVVSGNHTPEQAQTWSQFTRRFGLLGSAGSDFHGPVGGRRSIGGLPPLPAGCAPVWTRF